MMIEGSGSGAGSRSIPLTNGSGSATLLINHYGTYKDAEPKNNINRSTILTRSKKGEWEAADLGETIGDVDGARAQLVTQHAHHVPRCNLVRQVLFTQQEKAILVV